MKYALIAVVLGLSTVGALVAAYLLGLGIGMRRNFDNRLRDMGLNRQSGALYGRAAKILNRLSAVTDLDGVMAGDSLSPETTRQVNEWLADHRREISKG